MQPTWVTRTCWTLEDRNLRHRARKTYCLNSHQVRSSRSARWRQYGYIWVGWGKERWTGTRTRCRDIFEGLGGLQRPQGVQQDAHRRIRLQVWRLNYWHHILKQEWETVSVSHTSNNKKNVPTNEIYTMTVCASKRSWVGESQQSPLPQSATRLYSTDS